MKETAACKTESSRTRSSLFPDEICVLFLERADQIVEHLLLDSFSTISSNMLLYAFAKVLPNCSSQILSSSRLSSVEQLFLFAGNKYIEYANKYATDPLAGGLLTTSALKDLLWSFGTMASRFQNLTKVVGVAMKVFSQVELAFADPHNDIKKFTAGQLTMILWSFKGVQKWDDEKRFQLGRGIGKAIAGVLVNRASEMSSKDISIVFEVLSALHLRPSRKFVGELLGRLAQLVEKEDCDVDMQLLRLSNTLNAVVQLGLDEEDMAKELFRLVAVKVEIVCFGMLVK